MCCGSRRSAWRGAATAPRTPTPPTSGAAAVQSTASRPPAPFPTAPLQYLGASAMRVRGPVSGRRYDFTAAEILAVDIRDAAVLTRSGSFRRA